MTKENSYFDIDRSHLAIYRGTTSIIPAFSNGLIPIYYEIKNELSIDILYDLKQFRHKVSDYHSFNKIIINYHKLNHINFLNRKKIEK